MTTMVTPKESQVLMVPVDRLIPYSKNAKKHPEAQIDALAKMLLEFGFDQPIVVDSNWVIVKGHGRQLAAIKAGIKEVPVIISHLSAVKVRASRIADNRIAETDWEEKTLAEELKELDDDMRELTGFDEEEIERLLREPANGGHGNPDDIPVKVETRCQPGQLWMLGDHRLLCADSTDTEAMLRLIGSEKADCVWTDPPYNVAYEGKTKDALTIQNDKMGDDEFRKFLLSAFTNMANATVPGGAFYIAHADSEGYNFRGAARDAGFLVKQCLIWVKSTFAMGRQDYHWKHEPILYGWLNGASHKWYSDRKQTTVLEFDKPQRNAEHPTMKPVELVEYCLANSSARNDVVLDPFGGSGTTMIACETIGRRARLMEIDPKYCDVIIARWESFTGRKAVLG